MRALKTILLTCVIMSWLRNLVLKLQMTWPSVPGPNSPSDEGLLWAWRYYCHAIIPANAPIDDNSIDRPVIIRWRHWMTCALGHYLQLWPTERWPSADSQEDCGVDVEGKLQGDWRWPLQLMTPNSTVGDKPNGALVVLWTVICYYNYLFWHYYYSNIPFILLQHFSDPIYYCITMQTSIIIITDADDVIPGLRRYSD